MFREQRLVFRFSTLIFLTLMLTVFRMCMIMHPAGPVIAHVGHDDKSYGGGQQPIFVLDEKLLDDQKSGSDVKEDQWLKPVMVFGIAMPEREGSDPYGQSDHPDLKPHIVDDIDPEQGQGGEQ